MKKIAFIISILCGFQGSLILAQVPRVVLLEWFTSTGCGPCTWQGPRMDKLHDDNPTTLITLEYHGNVGNTDPMYYHNTAEPLSRFSYYSFTGYPSGRVDGNFYSGHPNNITQTTITNRAAVTSPFQIKLSHKINNNGTMDVNAVAKAVQAVSGNFKLHIVVVEKKIVTGKVEANGETHWTNVMKKMLPNQNGTALPASWAVNDSIVVNQSWALKNVYNVDEIAVLAFVQDNTTKEVFQSAFSQPSLDYYIDLDLNNNVYTKFVNKNSTATYDFDLSINSNIPDTYEISLGNTLPAGWSAAFEVGGQTYTVPTQVNLAAVDTKTVTVKVTSASNSDERSTVVLNVKSTTRIGAYVKQFKLSTFCEPTNLLADKYGYSATSMANAFNFHSMGKVAITDYEIDGIDTNGLQKNVVKHFIYSTRGINIFCGITGNKAKIITNYLASGGDLLMISESMGAEIKNTSNYYTISPEYVNFYANYIGANYISGNYSSAFLPVKDHPADSLYNDAGSSQLGGLSSFREWFSTKNGSKATLMSENSPTKIVACINSDTVNNWQIAFWNFGFGLLSNTDGYKEKILKTTIDWFDGVTGTGVANFSDDNSFMIYPNPVADKLSVAFDKIIENGITIRVFNALGLLVKSEPVQKGSDKFSFDISDLSDGVYMLELNNGDNSPRTQQFVVVK